MYSQRLCVKCGTKLSENAKYCSHCGNKVINSIEITVKGVVQEYEHNREDENASNIIINNLGLDKTLFEYAKPSQNYSTIKYKGFDLFRINCTDNPKWIQIPMTTQMRKANIDNPLFDAEQNKNKVFWKSNIKNLFDYKELLLETIDFREKEEQKKD